MRKNLRLFVMTSMLLSLCIPMCAQQPQDTVDSKQPVFNSTTFDETMSLEDIIKLPDVEIDSAGNLTVNGKNILNIRVNGKEFFSDDMKKELKQFATGIHKTVTPNKRGLVTNESYLAQLIEYAPEGFVCGYIMRDALRNNLWGIFLVKEKKKYNLVYKEADKLKKRKIKSDLASVLEASVNTKISKIEFDVNNPVFTEVFGGLPDAFKVYEGDIAFAVTPSKAAHFQALNGSQYNGINDEYWQTEIDQFKQADK